MPYLVDGEAAVVEVRDAGLEEEIAHVTGLTVATVRTKLREAHGRTKLRNLFRQWPERIDEIASWTAAFARERDAAREIAKITSLGVRAVQQRLDQTRGNTLVQNVFAIEWPNENDASAEAAENATAPLEDTPPPHKTFAPDADDPQLASIAPEPSSVAEVGQRSEWFRRYELRQARSIRARREPEPHQTEALSKLRAWYHSRPVGHRGGVLALPTGGGKTFTTVRFLCQEPLSEGYKVLWLAHTHHLLEQAIDAFGSTTPAASAPAEVAHIAEPREVLAVRVVSGTQGHFPPSSIAATDDVVIATLQTVAAAFHRRHPKLIQFLKSSNDKLFVVFDEAHHAPAPSYRKLLEGLRRDYPGMFLLGLTATPTYSDERRQGWLKNLFPQDVLATVSRSTLIAAGVLSKPTFEDARTGVTVAFDDASYQRWASAFGDLPEQIVSMLAENRQRNDFIADTYVAAREKYGKTLIFADRWYQCDYLREALRERGVRADVVYSHVDARRGTVDARNRRSKDENARVLERFRKSELDVLVNVRMLTEGTDVPSVQSVFLTRQTTSTVLLTQMIGRALRGPKFGGTKDAHIVSFTDNWKQVITFADYHALPEGEVGDSVPEYGKRPPLQLISIELVRRLARQMYKPGGGATVPFLRLLPVGWYRVEFETRSTDSDDVEWARQLVMVFDSEKGHYQSFIAFLATQDLEPYADETQMLDIVRPTLEAWRASHFSSTDEHPGSDLLLDMLSIARHMAQNEGNAPLFFEFDQRDEHDVDAIAKDTVARDMGVRAIDEVLRAEFVRVDRFWQSLYPSYTLFYAQYQAAVRRILDAELHGIEPEHYQPSTPEAVPPREPSEATKQAVFRRDGNRCCCCGSTRALEVDHITPRYLDHSHDLDRLQTLCRVCNAAKAINELNFRTTRSPLNQPARFSALALPKDQLDEEDTWRAYLRRSINFFYRCSAVDSLELGPAHKGCHVQLWPGIHPAWITPHLAVLVAQVDEARTGAGLPPIGGVRILSGE